MKRIIVLAVCLYLTDAHFRKEADRKIASVSSIAKENKTLIKSSLETIEQAIVWINKKLN